MAQFPDCPLSSRNSNPGTSAGSYTVTVIGPRGAATATAAVMVTVI